MNSEPISLPSWCWSPRQPADAGEWDKSEPAIFELEIPPSMAHLGSEPAPMDTAEGVQDI